MAAVISDTETGTGTIAESDGLNLYDYCGNDPVNGRDPSGLYATATVDDNNNVTINLPIQFTFSHFDVDPGTGLPKIGPNNTFSLLPSPYNQKVVNAVIADIKKKWEGKRGKYHVTVNITCPKNGPKNTWDLINTSNIHSKVPFEMAQVQSPTSVEMTDNGTSSSAHEASHLMSSDPNSYGIMDALPQNNNAPGMRGAGTHQATEQDVTSVLNSTYQTLP
jgi:hypothetical protein